MIFTRDVRDNTLVTLVLLHNSTFDFHPTGSRRFGTARADSDFDFHALATKELEDFLKASGFFLLTPPDGGWDENTHAIYRKGHVDVALLFSTVRRKLVEDQLEAHPTYLKYLRSTKFTATARRDFWNSFYTSFAPKGEST